MEKTSDDKLPIKYFLKRAPAFAYAERVTPPLPVFSFETPRGGAMRFLVCSYSKFVDMYMNTPENRRFYHEISVEDRPIKLFFDIDKSNDKSKKLPNDKSMELSEELLEELSEDKSESLYALGDRVVSAIDGVVTDMLKTNYLEPIRLNASSVEKMSIHLVYPVYFRNKSILIEFVDELMSRMTDDAIMACIDRGVYGRNHSLRIIGSRKRDSNRVLIGSSFSRDYILRSFLHCIGDGNRLIETWGGVDSVRVGRINDDMSTATMDKWSPTVLEKVKKRVYDYYLKRYGRRGMCMTWIGRSMCISLRPGLKCPVIGRVHKSNSSCVVVTFPDVCYIPLKLQVTIRCMDHDCNRVVIGRQVLFINFN